VDRMDIRIGEPHSSRSWRLETHHSLERTFMKKLQEFMKNRGTPLKYNGNQSLFKIYGLVTALGGFKSVCIVGIYMYVNIGYYRLLVVWEDLVEYGSNVPTILQVILKVLL
jgi:hypothetical protein